MRFKTFLSEQGPGDPMGGGGPMGGAPPMGGPMGGPPPMGGGPMGGAPPMGGGPMGGPPPMGGGAGKEPPIPKQTNVWDVLETSLGGHPTGAKPKAQTPPPEAQFDPKPPNLGMIPGAGAAMGDMDQMAAGSGPFAGPANAGGPHLLS